MYWGGVMHYVELDVNNLRRWLNGTIGSSPNGGCAVANPAATCPMDITGFVLYFSDRRLNRNLGRDNVADPPAVDPVTGELTYADDVETGEFGFEDIVNRADRTAVPATSRAPFRPRRMDRSLTSRACRAGPRTSTSTGRSRPTAACRGCCRWRRWPPRGAPDPTAAANYTLYGTPGVYGTPIDRNAARVNRAFFFRRALKLVNGGGNNLPRNGSGPDRRGGEPGLRPGQLQRLHERLPRPPTGVQPACGPGGGFDTNDHVSAAVIATP